MAQPATSRGNALRDGSKRERHHTFRNRQSVAMPPFRIYDGWVQRSWIGVDIGGTSIKAGRVDGGGKVVARVEVAAPDSLPSFRETILGLLQELGDAAGAGFGCRGIIDTSTSRVVISPGALRYLDGHYLSEFVPAGLAVSADNDARAALAGEVVWGAAQGKPNALMLTIGTGVGGGVVVDGRLLRGATGAGGHLGHINVDPHGPLCVCGARGCLETYVSARALEGKALAALHCGVPSALSDGAVTCESIFARAAEGDALSTSLLGDFFPRLGAAIAGLLFAFDSEIVILGGQISKAGPALYKPIQAEVDARIGPFLKRSVPVVAPACGDGSGIVGAAALAALYNQEC